MGKRREKKRREREVDEERREEQMRQWVRVRMKVRIRVRLGSAVYEAIKTFKCTVRFWSGKLSVMSVSAQGRCRVSVKGEKGEVRGTGGLQY